MGDADMTQEKQDSSDLITSASENVSSVTISSVLPDTTGACNERIKEINNFLKDKCRDTGARFVDNDQNFLFRDGSCDTSAFQNDGVRLYTCGVKRLMSNLSLASSKHREDGAKRGSSSQRGCITSRPTSNRPPKERRSGPASGPSLQGILKLLTCRYHHLIDMQIAFSQSLLLLTHLKCLNVPYPSILTNFCMNYYSHVPCGKKIAKNTIVYWNHLKIHSYTVNMFYQQTCQCVWLKCSYVR